MAKKLQSRHTLEEIDLAVDIVSTSLATPVESITVSSETGELSLGIGDLSFNIQEHPSNAHIRVKDIDVEITKIN